MKFREQFLDAVNSNPQRAGRGPQDIRHLVIAHIVQEQQQDCFIGGSQLGQQSLQNFRAADLGHGRGNERRVVTFANRQPLPTSLLRAPPGQGRVERDAVGPCTQR